MKKRVLALMLALVMALSLLPMMVAAEGEAQGGVNVENTEVAATPEQAGTTQPEESPAAVPEPTIEVPAELGAPMMAPAATAAANQLSALRVQIGFAIHPDYDYLLKNDGEDYNAPYTFDPTDYDYDFGAISVERATIDGMQKLNSLRFKMEAAEGAKVTIEYSNADGTRSSKEAFCVNHESNTDWVQLIKGENVVKLTVTPPTDSGLSETTYTLTLYVGEKPVVKDPAKVKVYFTFYDGKNYCFPVGRTEITAVEGTAAKYGMENAKAGHLVGGMDHSIKAGQVSVLDALLCAHEAVYGAAFTKDTMSSYFGGSSFVSKIFGVDGDIGYAVNDRLPMGTKGDGYAINEYALSEGDDVYFFIYSDSNRRDYLSYFDKRQLTVNAGDEITIQLTGHMAMEQMNFSKLGEYTSELTFKPITNGSVVLLAESKDDGSWASVDVLADLDSKGQAKFKFDKAGTYYVSAVGQSSDDLPITGPWCEITVNEAKPGDSDLNGMLVYNGTVANNTTVILKNADDSYTTTNVFEWNKYEYDLGTVTDSSNQLRFKLNLPAGAKATLHYTDLNGNAATKDATKSSSNAAWISCLKPGKNTVKVVITPPAGSTVGEKTYTINVNCQPSLTALALSANGNEAYLNPTFKNSVYDYSADISAAIETVLVTATPKDASCTVTYNGQTDSNVDIKDTDTIVVRVEKDGIYSEYTIKLNKKTAYTVKFETYPANAIVRLQDPKKAILSPNADGVYENLLPDTDYTWVVTCKGYVTKTGTLNTPAQLTNGVLSVILSAAPASNLPDYSGEWPTFRNSKNNNALTNTVTPDSAATAELKWVKKYGTGWSASTSIPIIVNNNVYFIMGSKIIRADKATGDVLREGTLKGSAGFSTNSLVYAEGMVFAQVGNGVIQAFNADTLESLWVTEAIGGQTISPITYYNGYIYTGMWRGETNMQNFACFSVTDEDPANGFETKYATWLMPHMGGYYWVGAYVNDVCAVFGSDDGTSDSNSPTAVLYSVNPVTGSVIDTINDVKGDIRCCVVYDSGRVYFTTKGGYLYSVGLNSNGTFDHASIKSIQIGSMSTSTPVIYKGRLYVGCSGKGYDWDGDSGSGIAVVDVSGGKLDIIYKASTPGYPQAGALVSTAFEAATGKVYVYTTYNKNPGGIYIIEDSAGQTEPSANNGDLYVPEKAYQQYCISTICADSEGTLYYKNDSGALIAVKSTAKLPDPPKPDYKPDWPGGSVFGPGSNVPTPPTAQMPVTGGEESILPIAMLIAGAVMLLALRHKKRV
ncbi:MAG: PQQ-binding-like beta-propeller repeat protein [Christensenellaceae bacterium]|nr:PQQ-binding-like beta-propeller repeat protein [Christensenellaceae bacterium]MDD6938563.1 PQQ-binding-like beta-propeller repeat protein [Christensenellaceae bacterium]MDY2748275.1 PQQ-binding-like beta-propeller repeat protein [Eubacteriales bacterium]